MDDEGMEPQRTVLIENGVLKRFISDRAGEMRTGHARTGSGRRQNHGFAVDPESLPNHLEITHLSLFDGSVEGLRHKSLPVFSVQYHPESSPGPHDSQYLFRRFADLVLTQRSERDRHATS